MSKVAPERFLSPTGSDGGSCSEEAPCRTFGRALEAAAPGDVVQVAGGFYDCAILSGPKHVVFRAATGARPWIACPKPVGPNSGASLVFSRASNLTFRDIWVAGVEWVDDDSSRIRFENVHVTCQDKAPFRLYDGVCSASLEGPANGFTMIGGEVGPTYACPGSGANQNRVLGSDLVLDGVTFGLNRRCEAAHTECLMVLGGDGITIENSRFPECNVFSIFFTCWPGKGDCSHAPPPKNVLLQNNYFGPGPQYYNVRMASHMPEAFNYDLRYNTATKMVSWDTTATGGSSMVGNVLAFSGRCAAGVTYAYNVFGDPSGRKCGDGTNVAVSSGFRSIDGVGVDHTGHLTATSRAIGRGSPADQPARDIDGDPRSVGAVDAGADQRIAPARRRVVPGKLFVSPLETRDIAWPLRGVGARRRAFVFVAGTPEMRRVRFYLDAPATGKATRTAVVVKGRGRQPAAVFAVDTRRLKAGRHAVTAVVEYRSGRSKAVRGTFLTS